METYKFSRGDLIKFLYGETVVIGQAAIVTECVEGMQQWRVFVVADDGTVSHKYVWENEAELYDRCDFNIRREVDFVVWDALQSGKNWTKVVCES